MTEVLEGELCSASDILGKISNKSVSSELGCNNKEEKLKFCPLLKFINFTGSGSENNMMKQTGCLVTLPEMSKAQGERNQKSCSLIQWTVGGGGNQTCSVYLPLSEFELCHSWIMYKWKLEGQEVVLGWQTGRVLECDLGCVASLCHWPQLTLGFWFPVPQFSNLHSKFCSS